MRYYYFGIYLLSVLMIGVILYIYMTGRINLFVTVTALLAVVVGFAGGFIDHRISNKRKLK